MPDPVSVSVGLAITEAVLKKVLPYILDEIEGLGNNRLQEIRKEHVQRHVIRRTLDRMAQDKTVTRGEPNENAG